MATDLGRKTCSHRFHSATPHFVFLPVLLRLVRVLANVAARWLVQKTVIYSWARPATGTQEQRRDPNLAEVGPVEVVAAVSALVAALDFAGEPTARTLAVGCAFDFAVPVAAVCGCAFDLRGRVVPGSGPGAQRAGGFPSETACYTVMMVFVGCHC